MVLGILGIQNRAQYEGQKNLVSAYLRNFYCATKLWFFLLARCRQHFLCQQNCCNLFRYFLRRFDCWRMAECARRLNLQGQRSLPPLPYLRSATQSDSTTVILWLFSFSCRGCLIQHVDSGFVPCREPFPNVSTIILMEDGVSSFCPLNGYVEFSWLASDQCT